jgi:hypothetical protein
MDVSRIIHADAGRVWEVIIDTRTWSKWGPSVKNVELPSIYISQGACGHVQTAVGLWLPFMITDFEPGAYWAWKVGRIQATGHKVEPLNSASCRLTFEVPNWGVPYALVCWLALRKIAVLVEN